MHFLVLTSVLGFAMLLRVLTKRDVCLCLLSAIPGLAGVLYLAALLNALHAASLALFYCGLAALAACLVLAVLSPPHRSAALAVLSPAPVIFLAGAIAYWFYAAGSAFWLWDEFSHWGLAARELILTNRLPSADTSIVFQDYPPGTALFYYFFMSNSAVAERVVYFAYYVLLAAPLTVLFRHLRWKQVHWLALTLVTVLLFLNVRGDALLSIYVDNLLAVYFAAILLAHFSSADSARDAAFLVPALFFVPLVKKPGIFLAFVALAIILVDVRLQSSRTLPGLLRSIGRFLRAALAFAGETRVLVALAIYAPLFALLVYLAQTALAFECLLVILAGALLLPPSRALSLLRAIRRPAVISPLVLWGIFILAPFAAQFSWGHWTKAHDLRPTFSRNYSLARAVSALYWSPRNQASDMAAEVCSRFAHERLCYYETTIFSRLKVESPVLERLSVPRLSGLGWTVLISLTVAVTVSLAQTSQVRLRLCVAWSLLLLALGAYLFGIYSTYYYTFVGGERRVLPGFERYVWIFVLPLALIGWGVARFQATGLHAISRTRSSLAFAFLIAFSSYIYFFENPLWLIVPPRTWLAVPPIRQRIEPQMEFIRSRTSARDKIYVVFHGASDFDQRIIYYELVPRRCNSMGVDIGASAPETPEQAAAGSAAWAGLLTREHYTCVYVGNAPEAFWICYAALFDPSRVKSDFLFRVCPSPDGVVVLSPVR